MRNVRRDGRRPHTMANSGPPTTDGTPLLQTQEVPSRWGSYLEHPLTPDSKCGEKGPVTHVRQKEETGEGIRRKLILGKLPKGSPEGDPNLSTRISGFRAEVRPDSPPVEHGVGWNPVCGDDP